MRKILLVAFCIFFGTQIIAQTPEDGLRLGWYTPIGNSARVQAIGGVMGSLGGDISANFTNPAGLGMYKTKEFVLSPGLAMLANSWNYRGNDTNTKRQAFNYGASGFVWGNRSDRDAVHKSHAISLAVAQVANFNNQISFSGLNNQSSFSEQFLEELTRDRADTNAALSNYIFGSSLAFRTFLIDKELSPQGQHIGYQSLVPLNFPIMQNFTATTRGGIHEIALSYATNTEEKLYLGLGLGIPIVSYRRDKTFTERDISGNTNNDFNFSTFTQNTVYSGVGINGKFGLIYRPQQRVRIGFAFHTPSLMSFRDEISASMTTDTEGYAGLQSETSSNLNSGNKGVRTYSVSTPWRAIFSGSYVFNEVADTKRQRAFLSADVEIVNHRGSRFRPAAETMDLVPFYDALNATIKEIYRPSINVKLGGELKFDPIAFRLGAAYFGSPYKQQALQANRLMFSGGIGYRKNGFFMDAAYQYWTTKDVQFPYVLADNVNTFANQRLLMQSMVVTLGVKF